MGNKFIIAIIILIIAVFGVSAYLIMNPENQLLDKITGDNFGDDMNNSVNISNNGTNSSNKNSTAMNGTNTSNNNSNNPEKSVSVSATQSGPSSASEGSSVSITWTVKNNGKVAISNVKGVDQSNSHSFGTIKPGESKSTTYSLYIPTDAEIAADFGSGNDNVSVTTESNSFDIGGYYLTYSANGHSYSLNSNSVKIALN